MVFIGINDEHMCLVRPPPDKVSYCPPHAPFFLTYCIYEVIHQYYISISHTLTRCQRRGSLLLHTNDPKGQVHD